MSVDCLQEKIRKLKNPSMLQISAEREWIPPMFLDSTDSLAKAADRYACEILQSLRDLVPAVRFPFSAYAMLGSEGLSTLANLTSLAKELGYYVLIDAPCSLTGKSARNTAHFFMEEDCPYFADGVTVNPYLGSDEIAPFVPYLQEGKKDVFVISRTGNKSAGEIQDLLSGRRLVHMAVSDNASRLGEGIIGRSGYSSLGVVYAAGAAESLKIVRQQHKQTFILIDGYDYPNANGKNCSYGFDQLGHGAIVCAEEAILGAWAKDKETEQNPVLAAVGAAQRMRKNILRYTTVL